MQKRLYSMYPQTGVSFQPAARNAFRKIRIVLSLFMALFLSWASASLRAEETIQSPNGKLILTFDCQDGTPFYSVTYADSQVVGKSALGLNSEPKLEKLKIKKVERKSFNSVWSPVWGEYSQIPDRHSDLNCTLQTDSGLALTIEFRVYDEGFAFRYGCDTQEQLTILSEKTEFRLPTDVVVFPIAGTESTFPENGVKFADFKDSCPPLTGKFSDGKAFSIMEAFAVNYPRLRWTKNASGAVQPSIRRTVWTASESKTASESGAVSESGAASESGDDQAFTPWRAMMLGENEAELVAHEYFIFNLNPPCDPAAFAWVQPGKTISNEMNCAIRKDALYSMIDFAAENGIRYVQIDWGWYGTEYCYTEEECAEWAKNNPEHAADPTWRANTQPDPRCVAQGRVPYFPQFHASTYVDINIEELVAYGKSKGVGICLYLNDRMIKSHDIRELFALYEKWGLAGLKPGFVAYGSAQNTDEIRYLAQTAAEHHLWLCIHDAYLPDGLSRTFPNVMNVEGGGGQEGNHPAFHDTVLPFTRGLVGPFDFTPAMFFHDRSNCHQLSLLITLYAPSHVIRSAWGIRNNTQGNAFGSEKEWFAAIGSEWVDTKVLDAEIGRRIVTARKTKDGDWFLGATNGSKACTSTVSLDFLEANREYELTLWTDAPEANGAYRGSVKTVKKVRSTDSLELPMAENGGAVAFFR